MSSYIKQFIIINGKNWFVGCKDGINTFFIDLENKIVYNDVLNYRNTNSLGNTWIKIIDITDNGKYMIVDEIIHYNNDKCGYYVYDISNISNGLKKIYYINLDNLSKSYKELEKYDKNHIKCYFSRNNSIILYVITDKNKIKKIASLII